MQKKLWISLLQSLKSKFKKQILRSSIKVRYNSDKKKKSHWFAKNFLFHTIVKYTIVGITSADNLIKDHIYIHHLIKWFRTYFNTDCWFSFYILPLRFFKNESEWRATTSHEIPIWNMMTASFPCTKVYYWHKYQKQNKQHLTVFFG